MTATALKEKFIINSLADGERLDIILEINIQQEEVKEKLDSKPMHISESSPNLISTMTGKQDSDFGLLDPMVPKVIKRCDSEPKDLNMLRNTGWQYFQNQMSEKYIEMINFNKDELLNYIGRDSEREKKILDYLQKIEEITKKNLIIEQENLALKKLLRNAGQGNKINYY